MPYRDFIEPFYRISENEKFFKIENYVPAVTELGKTERFMDFLNSIVEDVNVLEEVGRNSYIHANGFDKYYLHISERYGWKLRLHIWWDNPLLQLDELDVHNHAWDYASIVLNGELRNEVYLDKNIPDNSREYNHYEYKNDDITYVSTLDHIGVQQLVETPKSANIKKGEVYWQDSSILHRVYPVSKEVTATFVFQQSPHKKISDVYKGLNAGVKTQNKVSNAKIKGTLGLKNDIIIFNNILERNK